MVSSSCVAAPGSSGKREGGRPVPNLLAVQTVCEVAVARKPHQCSLFAFFIALTYAKWAALAAHRIEESWRSLLDALSVELLALRSAESDVDHHGFDLWVMGLRGVWRASVAVTLFKLVSNQTPKECDIRREGGGWIVSALRALSTWGQSVVSYSP